MSATVTVVALGDSFSCGEGVGLDICPEQTWPALLCAALPGSRLVNLSRAGARVRDVRRHQLPTAIATEAQLATVMVGLNDVIRSGLSAEQLTADLQVLVKGLVDSGASVLIARWHDPGVVLRLPIGLRRALGARLTTVNNAVDAAVSSAARRHSGTRVRDAYVLDLAGVPELADPGAWAVDGIHPSPAGHRAIARSAWQILASNDLAGLPGRIQYSDEGADLLVMPPGASRSRRARWLCLRGLPWLAQHSGRVVPAVVSMAAEAIREPRPPTGLQGPPTGDQALAVWLASAARDVQRHGVEVPRAVVDGAVVGGAVASDPCAQPLQRRRMTGIGQRPRAPEVARSAG